MEEHLAVLEGLGIDEAARRRLAVYLDQLARWSRRVNLSGARTAAERVAILVTPVVAVAPDIASGDVLDVGSGNGSPGLVLGLLRPDLHVTLLEPRTKRWAFLRDAARASGRADLQVRRERVQDYGGPPVRTVTVRALRLPLWETRRLLRDGGQVIVFGAQPEHEAGFEMIPSPATWPPGVHRFVRRASDARSQSGVPRETRR